MTQGMEPVAPVSWLRLLPCSPSPCMAAINGYACVGWLAYEGGT